jgi:hypothetical protein
MGYEPVYIAREMFKQTEAFVLQSLQRQNWSLAE